MTIRTIRVALAGLGAVNRALLTILAKKETQIAEQFGLSFQVTTITDSSGAAFAYAGFNPIALTEQKAAGNQVTHLPATERSTNFVDFLSPRYCDLLFEATPVNLHSGEPGLTFARSALEAGIHVVLANKGPLVHNFDQLCKTARNNQCEIAYSATVCGALPVINIGQRDLVTAEIQQIRGIFNSTTNYILGQMERGDSFTTALTEAQKQGIAETDPTLDIEGWDTANKLVIIVNSILDIPAKLSDIAVIGIQGITTAQLQQANAQGQTIKLVASAQRIPNGYQLRVGPMLVARDEFLGRCNGWEMGIEFQTDIYGTLYHKSWENSPLPTAAAMLRDAINLYQARHYPAEA